MKLLWLTIGFIAIWLLPSQAQQQIRLKFQLYQGDTAILDALETRLLAGGTPAVEAMKKMPDFVRSRKVESIVELELEAISGQRAKGASGKEMLKVDDEGWQVVDGLGVEVDAVFNEPAGTINANLATEWGRREGGSVRLSKLTTMIESGGGEPVLLKRWSGKDTDRMLILTATCPGKQAARQPGKMIYFDTTVYESEADALARRDPVARMIFPTQSGQRSRAEDIVPLLFEVDEAGSVETANAGFSVEMDPVLGPDGTSVDLNAAVKFSEERSGKERTAGGLRVPRVEIRQAVGQAALKSGEAKPFEMKKSSLANPQAEPDDWRATFGFRLGNAGAVQPNP